MEVGAVVQASADVKINTNEEKGCAVSVHVSNESAVVNITADVGNGGEGGGDIGGVVYG